MQHAQPVIPESNIAGAGTSPCGEAARQGQVCPALPSTPDDGIDLLDASVTLLRGWKTIVALMVVAAVVGFAAVSRTPSRYRASITLQTVLPGELEEPTPLSFARLGNQPKVEPALLQQYALLLRSEENLRRTAEEAGLAETEDGLPQQSTIDAAPVKDASKIQVSVTSSDPAVAKRLANACVDRGLQSLAVARQREIEATSVELQAERYEALKTSQQKQRQLRDLRRERGLNEKQAALKALERQMAAMQQAVHSSGMAIRALEARTEASRERLKTTPATKKERYRLDQLPEFSARLASRLNVSPLAISGLEIELERANPARQSLEDWLAQDEVALCAARRIVEETPSAMPAVDEQIRTLESELDDSAAEFKLAERELGWAQEACFAADKALADWKKESERQFPALARDKLSPISVRPVGTSPFSRLLLLEAGAFLLACVVVLTQAAYRKRVQPMSTLAVESFAGERLAPVDRQPLPEAKPELERMVA